jgi:hypothetical protein
MQKKNFINKYKTKLIVFVLTNTLLTTFAYSQKWHTAVVNGNVKKIANTRSVGIAVGDNGLVLKTTDNGLTFKQINTNINDNLVDVINTDDSTFFACGWKWGSHGVLIKSIDSGNTWSTVLDLNGSFNELFGLSSIGRDTIFVSGTNQLIRTFDGFSSHKKFNFPDGYQYKTLFFKSKLILMSHGGSISMRTSSDFGLNCTGGSAQPSSNMLRDMTMSNNKLYAIGDNGAYCSSTDGEVWKMIPTKKLMYLNLLTKNNKLYTCDNSQVFEINDNGDTLRLFRNTNINGIGKSSNQLFVLGTNFIAHQTLCSTAVIKEPQNKGCFSGSLYFTLSTNDTTANYQWQTNQGIGWVNLSSAGQYSGVAADSLVVKNVTSSNDGQLFRCIVIGNCGKDTTREAKLSVWGVGVVNPSGLQYRLAPNPVKDILSVQGGRQSISVYQVYTITGQQLLTGVFSESIDLRSLKSGVYLISINGQITRFMKE